MGHCLLSSCFTYSRENRARLPPFSLFLYLVFLSICGDCSLSAQIDWPTIGFLQVVTNGFGSPTSITHAGDGSQRLFVEERGGYIWIIQSNNVLSQPFLDLSSRVLTAGAEQGLLGLAFPPGYSTNSHFYVDYTRQPDGAVVVSRFFLTLDSNVADTNSEQVLLVIPKPYNNHNGGQIAFGPDGYLYVGVGDGGSEADPQNRGQNPATLLGKLLRIDVENGVSPYSIPPSNPFVGNTNYAPEIWALGLRNPWRFSFDRTTGDLYIGDVGQNRYEEIDFQPAGSVGGQNYGWRIMEGPATFNVPAGFTNFSVLTTPVSWYDHASLPTDFAGAVTGGYVYRGNGQPRMAGLYIFGDFMAGSIWGLIRNGTNWQSHELLHSPPYLGMSTFGEDESGGIYLANYSGGGIYKIQDTNRVWTPTFSPSNKIATSNMVLVTCLTPGALIHYTTNGVDPTEVDPIVPPAGLIQINNGGTNKAKAFRTDLLPSSVGTGVFGFKVGTPVFTPAAGAITNSTPVTITTETPGAVIYYTLDRSTPTTNSPRYSPPLSLSGGSFVRAMGVASGFSNSVVTNISYSTAGVVTPVFTPSAGPITNSTSISMSCATPGATIYYTLNGSTPTTNSAIYSNPFQINGGVTVKAFAAAPGYASSGIQSVFFSLVQTAAPVFSPASGPITNGTAVMITCATPGSVVYYTLDGSTPTTNSPPYSGPVVINGGTTLTALAVADQHLDSIQSVFYQLVQTATPAFNPASGPITNGTLITVTCATPGSTIYYTMDGSTPTNGSPTYSGPVTINGGTTLKAFASADQHLDSSIQSVFYELVQTATPAFAPGSAPVTYGTGISISCATPGSTIYYTLEGTIPSTNSPLYMTPVAIYADTILSALAVAPEHLDSAVQSVFYTLTKAETPIFNPSQPPLTNRSLISISSSSSNATIRFTLDGSNPDTNSAVYSGPLLFTNPITLTARAYRNDLDPSDAQSIYYSLIDLEKTVVTTLAGGTNSGLSNAVGTLARFSNPQGICIDKGGNVYVADLGNNVIRKILPTGQVTTFAGSGIAGTNDGSVATAQFNSPVGVCADSFGAIYVANDCITVRKISNGLVTSVATVKSGCAVGQVAVDTSTNIYIGPWALVDRISPNGTVTTLAGSGGNGYQGWSANVSPFIQFGTNLFASTSGVTENHIYQIASDGTPSLYAGIGGGFSDGPRLLCLFQDSQSAASDSLGNVLVSDYSRVRKITTNGWVSTLAGTNTLGFQNGPGPSAQFNYPAGVCADTNGNVYVADSVNNCIRKISPDTAGIGIADDWQVAHFGHVGIDPNDDPDHDGQSNYAEFWAGTDPLDSSSVLKVNSASIVNSHQTQITWQSVAGKIYTVKYSSDLVNWNILNSSVQATGSATSVVDTTPIQQGGHRFYRVFLNF